MHNNAASTQSLAAEQCPGLAPQYTPCRNHGGYNRHTVMTVTPAPDYVVRPNTAARCDDACPNSTLLLDNDT
jgi:hypothetical protein